MNAINFVSLRVQGSPFSVQGYRKRKKKPMEEGRPPRSDEERLKIEVCGLKSVLISDF
jgi:hypothetical protein